MTKFLAEVLVRIEVIGDKTEDPNKDARTALPRVRDDHGLSIELGRWLLKENIYSAQHGLSGGGRYIAYFYPEDAMRVIEWLNKKNIEMSHEQEEEADEK